MKAQLQGNVEVGGVGSDLVGTCSHERCYNLSGSSLLLDRIVRATQAKRTLLMYSQIIRFN